MPRFDHQTAGWEARMLPLCYADNTNKLSATVTLTATTLLTTTTTTVTTTRAHACCQRCQRCQSRNSWARSFRSPSSKNREFKSTFSAKKIVFSILKRDNLFLAPTTFFSKSLSSPIHHLSSDYFLVGWDASAWKQKTYLVRFEQLELISRFSNELLKDPSLNFQKSKVGLLRTSSISAS